ncbi:MULTISPECIES: antibiotic ABC transporter permease [Haloferax]|uniref:Antibiotic ABC transporter permease n=1 Tax=Haloferax marinum TaxID=2666143 RepID=A0A6A8GEF3_9EURY|nr:MULTISPECIES: antibiotic ABC transporter permease [Haloferax]KAB1191274.1 antibiotic ABC transporter permease [Haloferax sp. CBA1150]MRW98166.1 antibiotic ABC transporter permease [Haloferax marinum]
MSQNGPLLSTLAQASNGERRPPLEFDGQHVSEILAETLEYARERDYIGWDYGDGMSSRLLKTLPFENKWVNLVVQELVKRPPINVRPLFLVEKRRNYKGTALFTIANLNYHHYAEANGEPTTVDYLEEARQLADWLVENRSIGYHGFCGGHKHEIQHLEQKGVPNDPDVVSTSFAVKALLEASPYDPIYAPIARTASDFVVEDLDYREVEGGAKVNYHMNHPDTYYTLNSGALGARLFVDLYDHFGDDIDLERATAILDFIASHQADIGGWTYRVPKSSSHLSMDNHHNGFILDAFLRYRAVSGSDRFDDTIERGLTFFRSTLFEPDGAPNWDESKSYPRDIHAAATAIAVFSAAGDLEMAGRILRWTLENLYAGNGRFYYRKHKFFTVRTTLMRWAQAWMAYAMSEYLLAVARESDIDHDLENWMVDPNSSR